jgi:hypothetical protein
LGIIFDNSITFSQHLSLVSKSCLYHIRDLRRIRNTIDRFTACTIATTLVHSKVDYCNSLFLNLPSSQTNRLQLILNAAARAVTKTPKLLHLYPTLKSLHCLKINQRIRYKILSVTHKTLHCGHPSYLRSLLNLKQSRFTRSSSPSHLLALLIRLVSKSLVDLSITLLLLYGTLSLLIFVRSHIIILHQLLLFSYLHLSSTKNLKLISFAGLFLLSRSPSSTTWTDISGTDLAIDSSSFHFLFLLILVESENN